MVSIHALVQRATRQTQARGDDFSVSIHALVQRATAPLLPAMRPSTGFNPRPRAEGDRTRAPGYRRGESFNPRPRAEGDIHTNAMAARFHVSIHALVQRATDGLDFHTVPARVSIHALVQRATQWATAYYQREGFQSTPSCRGRHLRSGVSPWSVLFQSTPSCRGRPAWE